MKDQRSKIQTKNRKYFVWNLCFCFLLFAFCFPSVGCAGRLPSTSTSTKIIRHHFNKYGKKYKTSLFNGKRVSNVEILSVDEIHKHRVSVQAFVSLGGGDVQKVRVTIEKGPFGWRYVAWENLSGN